MLKAIPRSCHLLWILENLLGGATGETSEIVSKGCLQASATAELKRRAWRRLVFLVEAELRHKNRQTSRQTKQRGGCRKHDKILHTAPFCNDNWTAARSCDATLFLCSSSDCRGLSHRVVRHAGLQHFWSKESSTNYECSHSTPNKS